MRKKMSQRRCAAFLRALGVTGNVTLAAERACVSRSWVCKRRGEDPDFDSACREAVAGAAERLKEGGSSRVTAKGWGTFEGAELVVRGSNRRRLQIARARAHQFSPKVERRFLAALAATCNVKAAMAQVGMSKGAAYSHRKRWPAFARKWDEAVWMAYDRLEEALALRAENLFSDPEHPPLAPIPPMTVDQAIHLLHMHKHQVHGVGKRPGARWRPPPTLEAQKPSILRKLSAFANRRRG